MQEIRFQKKCCHQLRFRIGRELRWGAMPRKLWAGTLQTVWLLFWLLNAPPCTSRCSSSDFTPLSASHALDEDNLLICRLSSSSLGRVFFVFHGCDFKRSTRCTVAVDLSNRAAVKRISLWNCQPWDKTEWAYLRSSRRLVVGAGLGGGGVQCHAVGNTSQCVWWRWSASEQQK